MNKKQLILKAKKSIETQRIRKTGWFKKGAKEKSAKWRKENKAGFYDKEKASKAGLKGVKTQIKNKIGFFSKKSQHIASKLGFEAMCKNKNIKYFGVLFMSKRECEIAMCLYNQYKIKPIKNKSFQIEVDKYFFDFYIEKFDCFIEVHEVIKYFNKNETNKSYYKKRRKILDNNNLKIKYLIVII